jgi:Tfp pilus assembly protein PilV
MQRPRARVDAVSCVNTCSSPISASRLSREDGFGLIEVLVSVVMLAVISLGVLAMIDGPTAVSGASRARSTASALAQQDQDRMRGLTVTDLAGFSSTRAVVISGVSYMVRSKAAWVSDSSGTESCTSNDNQAHYLKITSSVTWPSIGTNPPVVATSLLAPPASLSTTAGSLAVQVTDQAGAAVTDLPVTVSPGSFSTPTNSAGCAFFGALALGNITAAFGQTGWVDMGGNRDVTLGGSVTAGSTTTLTASYAAAAQIDVGFNTKVGNAAPVAARATSTTIVNPSVPPPGFRIFTVPNPSPTISATNVYPFTSGYGVYAGNCSAANPVTYNPNYFTQNPGSYARPGPRGTASVSVREPALNVKVTKNGLALANAHVIVKPTGTGCTGTVAMTTDSAGLLLLGAAPYQAPAVPFGTYSVCADDGTRSSTAAAVANSDPNGNQAAQRIIIVPASGTGSVCT